MRYSGFLLDLEIEFDVSFAHTRWASVGSITEGTCHPVNNFTLQQSPGIRRRPAVTVRSRFHQLRKSGRAHIIGIRLGQLVHKCGDERGYRQLSLVAAELEAGTGRDSA